MLIKEAACRIFEQIYYYFYPTLNLMTQYFAKFILYNDIFLKVFLDICKADFKLWINSYLQSMR